MKLYKITAYIIGFNGLDGDTIRSALKNHRYISPSELEIEEADIGEWDDEHLLNYKTTPVKEFEKYFDDLL